MAPGLYWVDFNQKHRRQMINIIGLFQDKGTVDELGIGTIRDAFADYFFPGTGTVQTRARYFLFIPWLYIGLEAKEVPSGKVSNRAREAEYDLIETLLASGATDGVIGRVSRRTLVRTPARIYWNGLSTLGIRLFDGDLESYHRSLDTYYTLRRRAPKREGDEATAEQFRPNWHRGIPRPPEDFPKAAKLALLKHEAEYLRERVLLTKGESVFARLLREPSHTQAKLPCRTIPHFKHLPLMDQTIT